jgi:tRNA A-37 threonylcarbamoyl transferase component Bud32
MPLYHDTICIEPAYRERLRRARLDSTERVLKCIGDQIVAWSRSTDAVRADLPPEAGGGTVFIKRYHHPRWRKRIKVMLRGTFFGRSRARAEFDELKRMLDQGAPMVRPVAFGERRILHFLRSSFLMTEGVTDAVSLMAFAQQQGGPQGITLPPAVRRAFVVSLGRCIGDLHGRGVVHGALFWRNVLVRRPGPDRFDFVFLDAPARKRRSGAKANGCVPSGAVGDLACLAAMATEFCSQTEMVRFLRSYLGVRRLHSRHKLLARTVMAAARPLRAHEVYRLRMDRVFHYHLVPTGPPRAH